MKRFFILYLILFIPLSCYNGLSDMYDNLGAKVPICVKSSAPAGGDGRGWERAFNTLNSAVASAKAGDEIWVAGNPNDIAIITISKQLSIYGGFNGTESRREDRFLKSGISRRLNINSAAVVNLDGLSFNSLTAGAIDISGGSSVAITNCYFSGNTNAGSGGAVSIDSGNLFIYDSTFNSNSASGSANGGAVYSNNSNVTIENSSFGDTSNGNSAYNGGALYILANSTNVNLTIKDSHFNKNQATNISGHGGAIYINNSNSSFTITTTISSCKFGESAAKNIARNGGAISVRNTGNIVKITDTTFKENEANQSGQGEGGGIYLENTSAIIKDSVFNNNNANNGGAINITNNSSGSVQIDRCKILSNIAAQQGGGVYLKSTANSSITNTLFYNNTTSSVGAALFVDGGTGHILVGNTFYYNTGASNDGAIYFAVNSSIYNTAFYGNTSGNPLRNNIITFNSTIRIYNSFYNGGATFLNSPGSIIETGCITGDSSNPFLSVTSTDINFLFPATVLVNAGNDAAPGISLFNTDLAGNPRMAGTVDIGAYERQ